MQSKHPLINKNLMNGFIKLSVINVDDQEFEFRIRIENNLCKTSLDFYEYADDLKDFGNKLMQFPTNINDKVAFQLGEDDRKWAYYMSIEAFCFDSSGHTALKIIVDNMGDTVNGYRTEFTIKSEAASINALGQMLASWNPSQSEELVWESFIS